MATRNKYYAEPERIKTITGECQFIYELASMGLSQRSIGTRLAYKPEDFQKLLSAKVKDKQPFLAAYEAGMAEFEHVNAQTLIDAIEDPESVTGIQVKVARDNLKAKFEDWAPQTRAVKVQIEDAAQVLQFEAYTEKEEEAIKGLHIVDDPEYPEEN
jgi:hypothetical protein